MKELQTAVEKFIEDFQDVLQSPNEYEMRSYQRDKIMAAQLKDDSILKSIMKNKPQPISPTRIEITIYPKTLKFEVSVIDESNKRIKRWKLKNGSESPLLPPSELSLPD